MVRWKFQRLKHCCRRLYRRVPSADNADDCSTNDWRITAFFRRVLCSWSVYWPRNQAQCWGGFGFVVAVVVVVVAVVVVLFCFVFRPPRVDVWCSLSCGSYSSRMRTNKSPNNVKQQAGKWITSKILFIKITLSKQKLSWIKSSSASIRLQSEYIFRQKLQNRWLPA